MPVTVRALFGRAPIKLIAVILFAILVPSVMVTALGLVAVFQADAFVMDRFSRPLREKLGKLFDRLEADWSGRLGVYAEYLRGANRRQGFLGELRRLDPELLRDILVSGPKGLESVPDPPPVELWSAAAGGELKELNRLEVMEKNFPGALAECRRLLASSQDGAVLVEALLAAARLTYRLGDREESEQFLRAALEEFGSTTDSTGMVRAVPILWRLTDLQREQGHARFKDTARSLAQALAAERQRLDPEVFSYYREKVASLGDASLARLADGEGEPLGHGGASSQRGPARLFSAEHVTQLVGRLRGIEAFQPGQSWIETHCAVDELGALDFVSFPLPEGGMVVHAVLDPDRWLEEVRLLCADVGLPPEGLLLGSKGSAAPAKGPDSPAPGAHPIVTRRLPAPLSNLNLGYAPPSTLLPEGFRGFNVITLAAFTWAVIVLVLTIVVGVLFTLRYVLREVHTARLKSDFVSFISHELKTPLTAIRTLAETMRDGKVEGPEESQMCLELIGNETERLSKLVEQVLEYSRIERRQKEFRFTSCAMEDVVKEAVRIFQDHNRLDPRSIEINTAQHISKIKMDRAAMIELLLNLLSNAAKYSPRDKRIVVNLRETIHDICVEVVDRGIGIRKRDQKRIFEKFFRAEDYLTREVEGTGLGLTFARYIAKVHNGDIKVSSQVNSGSTFTLQLRKTHVLAE